MTTTHSTRIAALVTLGLLHFAFAAALCVASSSQAEIVLPSPNPPPVGILLKRYTVPGVYGGDGYIGTEFFCTSLETSDTVHMGIDVLDDTGVKRNKGKNNGVADLKPGETVIMGTIDSPAFQEDYVMTFDGPVEPGSARIWSNSRKLMCGAILVPNDENVPPTSMVELKVIKGNFQTGD